MGLLRCSNSYSPGNHDSFLKSTSLLEVQAIANRPNVENLGIEVR